MKSPLLNKRHVTQYLTYGALAALGYLAGALVFIIHNNFDYTWWLYVGNVLFMFFIFLYARALTVKKEDKLSAMTMLMAGHSATITGIVLACVLTLISLFVIQPGIVTSAPAQPLAEAPAQVVPDKGGTGIAFMIFINATIVNFCIGSFISLISSYAIKRNQTKDKPAPLNV
ncbi:MAG: hypothetical protein JO301_11955 [Chitinophagaceae bacterium]|nr:hypothetical protein [Chitinophagaceae bacterium]